MRDELDRAPRMQVGEKGKDLAFRFRPLGRALRRLPKVLDKLPDGALAIQIVPNLTPERVEHDELRAIGIKKGHPIHFRERVRHLPDSTERGVGRKRL